MNVQARKTLYNCLLFKFISSFIFHSCFDKNNKLQIIKSIVNNDPLHNLLYYTWNEKYR